MKIAVYQPASVPRSMTITTGCVTAELEGLGVELIEFGPGSRVPEQAELVWDPWVGGGNTSELQRGQTSKPIVLTVAGASLFTLPLAESGLGPLGRLRVLRDRARLRRAWRRCVNDYACIITISEYARQELLTSLPLIPERLVPVHLGTDERLADLADASLASELRSPYFLHLSFYQPKKNVDRLIEAYLTVADEAGMPALYVVSTEYPGTCSDPRVHIVARDVSRAEIATFYRGATAFVFPSLHETFAMPLTEAMLFGLPLLTANTTVCPETAGDAALLVDPLSVASIAQGLRTLAIDASRTQELAQRSLVRGKLFTWSKTAEAYLELFERVLREFQRAS